MPRCQVSAIVGILCNNMIGTPVAATKLLLLPAAALMYASARQPARAKLQRLSLYVRLFNSGRRASYIRYRSGMVSWMFGL